VELNGTHELLVYAYNFHLLGETINTVSRYRSSVRDYGLWQPYLILKLATASVHVGVCRDFKV